MKINAECFNNELDSKSLSYSQIIMIFPCQKKKNIINLKISQTQKKLWTSARSVCPSSKGKDSWMQVVGIFSTMIACRTGQKWTQPVRNADKSSPKHDNL